MENLKAFVTQKMDGRITKAECSACGEALELGNDVGSAKEQEMKLKGAFGRHMTAKHSHEDASQAAVRFVVEATKD